MTKVWMDGHTCLNCGKGFYDGYDLTTNSTNPCSECGSQAPASMIKSLYRRAIKMRDSRIDRETKPATAYSRIGTNLGKY